MLMHGIQRLNGDGRSVKRHAIAHITYTAQARTLYLPIQIYLSEQRICNQRVQALFTPRRDPTQTSLTNYKFYNYKYNNKQKDPIHTTINLDAR